MTSKEKAKELVDDFYEYAHASWHESYGWDKDELKRNAKRCALICVNKIIENISYHPNYKFWKEVKQEIEKL